MPQFYSESRDDVILNPLDALPVLDAGRLYGRRMYEVMRHWDQDQPERYEIGHDFAQVSRSKPKWVAFTLDMLVRRACLQGSKAWKVVHGMGDQKADKT